MHFFWMFNDEFFSEIPLIHQKQNSCNDVHCRNFVFDELFLISQPSRIWAPQMKTDLFLTTALVFYFSVAVKWTPHTSLNHSPRKLFRTDLLACHYQACLGHNELFMVCGLLSSNASLTAIGFFFHSSIHGASWIGGNKLITQNLSKMPFHPPNKISKKNPAKKPHFHLSPLSAPSAPAGGFFNLLPICYQTDGWLHLLPIW